MFLKKKIIFGVIVLVALLPHTASAIDLQVPLPGLASVDNFSVYLMFMYKFLVGSIGVIAVVMIMVGGFQWLTAAGSQERISGAKTTIFSSIGGLLIALGSFTILQIINPNLTKLQIGAIPRVTGDAFVFEEKNKICGGESKPDPHFVCGKYYQPLYNNNPISKGVMKTKGIDENGHMKDSFCIGFQCNIYGADHFWGAAGCVQNHPEAENNDFARFEYSCAVLRCPDRRDTGSCDWYSKSSTYNMYGSEGLVKANRMGEACSNNLCNFTNGNIEIKCKQDGASCVDASIPGFMTN